MTKHIAVTFCSVLLLGCASQPDRLYTSPSGRPEAIFDGQMPSAVLGKLAGLCMDRRGVVISQDSNQVVCQKELPPGDALLAQLAIGNAYSTTPVLKIRFSAAQTNGGTRIQVYEWIETQMAFGQMQTMEVSSNREFNSVEQLLMQLGGRVSKINAAGAVSGQ
jgi:hypothetical protein